MQHARVSRIRDEPYVNYAARSAHIRYLNFLAEHPDLSPYEGRLTTPEMLAWIFGKPPREAFPIFNIANRHSFLPGFDHVKAFRRKGVRGVAVLVVEPYWLGARELAEWSWWECCSEGRMEVRVGGGEAIHSPRAVHCEFRVR